MASLGDGLFVSTRFCFRTCLSRSQFSTVAARYALLRLCMACFTCLFFPFESCLTRFKPCFRFQRPFGFQIDSPQLGFFLAVILHQRDVAGTNIGAGTAFNTVINMVRTGFIMIAALAVPVKLLRQQLSRAGISTGRAANTGLLLLVVAHFRAGRCQNTVGDFNHRDIQ